VPERVRAPEPERRVPVSEPALEQAQERAPVQAARERRAGAQEQMEPLAPSPAVPAQQERWLGCLQL